MCNNAAQQTGPWIAFPCSKAAIPTDSEPDPLMKSLFTKSLFAACLCLLPTLLQAQTPDIPLKLDLNAYYQAKFSTNNKKVSGRVGINRVDSKQFIKLIAKQTGRSFPRGSRLMVSESGRCTVADSSGNTVIDATPFIEVKFLTDGAIFNGSMNTSTGRRDSRNYYMVSLNLKLDNLKGVINGVAIEIININNPSGTGVQTTRRNIKSDVNGKGGINGGTGYFEGSISLVGRTAEIR